jgi:uncharacterized glyoxalase superfamily protein PhnB
MAEAAPRPAFIPSVIYKDNRTALKWLEKAFGFEISEVLIDANDNIVHAEMSHGDGIVMIGYEWADWTKSPASIGGANTQRIFVHLQSGIDEHCERARKAGATIAMGPADQFYGERSYMAVDPEGHHWTFSQTVKHATAADYAQAGFKSKKLG